MVTQMPGLRRSSVFEIPRHGALKAKRFGATKAADHKLPYGISRHSKHEAYVIWRRRVESESEYDARNGVKDCLYISYYLPLASGYAMRPSWLFSCQYLTSPSVLPWHAHHPESLQFGSSALTNICAALEVESVQASAPIKHNLRVHRQGLWLKSVTLARVRRALARANPHKSYPDVVSPSGFLNLLLFFPAGPMDSPRRCFVPAVRV